MQVVIEIPKEVLYDTKQTIEQATDFAKRATALGFYKQYGVSVELCSQIAGITEKKFISEAKRSFIVLDKCVRSGYTMPSDRTTETCEACSPERLLRGSFRYYRTDKKWF